MNRTANVRKCDIKRDAGMSLIVSLIFLLIVSVVGMSVLNVSTVSEKMAAGTRDKDLAFQAAEIAIRKAETYIETSVNGTAGFSTACTNGLCAEIPPNSTSSRWEDANYCSPGDIWQCSKSVEVNLSSVSPGTFSKNPRYFIELLGDISNSGGKVIVIDNIGDTTLTSETQVYRITALGFGGSNHARVLLQSTYGKRI